MASQQQVMVLLAGIYYPEGYKSVQTRMNSGRYLFNGFLLIVAGIVTCIGGGISRDFWTGLLGVLLTVLGIMIFLLRPSIVRQSRRRLRLARQNKQR
ncbi:MAG: hypothetical protein AMJ65_15710 [Phycisphaerae bacterium SG8_4]|nr:MAG: hypothetical protein AMJ65_15710 [Phycisphaerae bacterium SG8_4]